MNYRCLIYHNIYDTKDFNNDGVKDILVRDGETFSVYSLAPYKNLPEIHVPLIETRAVTPYPTEHISGTVKGEVSRLLIAGQEVAVAADGSFEYLWTLSEGKNGIEVIAVTPDNKITKVNLTITYTIPPPLTLTIDSPQDEATINQSTTLVSGTVSDSSASVTVNGITAQLVSNTFQADVSLTEGLNTITATATDLFDRTISQSINLHSITKGSVSGIARNSSGQPLVGVIVTVQESGGASVSSSTTADGSYLFPVVSQGDVSITFQKNGYIDAIENATITAGETLIVNAQLAAIPPLIIDIVSPLDGETVIATPVSVSGNISNSSANVTVNGVSAAISDNVYQADVDLTEGLNTITAVADGPYGQSASASMSLTLVTKGSIGGKVTAKSTGLAVEGATVSITDSKGTLQSATTDADGDFLIHDVAGGAFSGTVSQPGYITNSFNGNLVPGETLTVHSVLNLSPPSINNIAVDLAVDEAVISWTTDQPADSGIEYGETTSYGQIVSSTTLQTSHSLTLSGLSPATTYHFRVVSANSDGSTALSSDATFTTLSLPVISNIFVSNITGNSATIRWTTDLPTDSFVEYGESAVFDLAVGDAVLTTDHSADLTGLVSGQTYHFRVSSTSNQGVQAVSADNQFNTLQVMTLTITSPVEGEILSSSSVLVQGSIAGNSGEIGVTANGIIALVDNTLYAANHVNLQEGSNTITVTATDTEGNVAHKSVSVTVAEEPKRIKLSASLESSLAPMETDIRIDGNFPFAGPTNLSYTGPSQVKYLTSNAESYTVRMTVPGLYYFSGTAQDELGDSYTDTIAILAFERTFLDTLLQAKWNGMKTALSSVQIDSAAEYFHPVTKSSYRKQFEALSSVLPQIVTEMGAFRLVEHDGYGAIYDLRAIRDNIEYSFQVLFIQDENGIWKIYNY